MKKIAVLAGDGIGPEIMAQALKVLTALKLPLEFEEALVGGVAYAAFGHPLPAEVVELAKKSDAVLFGAVGDFKYDNLPRYLHPEQAILGLRKALGLFVNLRPAICYPELTAASARKPELVSGLDLLLVRELTGDVYFGQPRGKRISPDGVFAGTEEGFDTMRYAVPEVERIAHVAFKAAMGRSKHLVSVDKANVLESSRLWRKTVAKVAERYPEVKLENFYVDNTAMQLVYNPKQFDVIVTSNIFGDILSDEASMITGSIGMLSSASLNESKFGLYEPSHGSAPDIAGKDIANPIATILSAAMMLRFSFDLDKEADAIEDAVRKVLSEGYRTVDIMDEGKKQVGTTEMGNLICDRI